MTTLTCLLAEGWNPQIHPAPATRDWMTESQESFAYRCLPLNIANSHGWEVLCPCDFRARWNGGGLPSDVEIETLQGEPVTLFGLGTFTFHIQGLFRTEPGWNLWVGPSPNFIRDGVQGLTGIVETDWSPFTFTMNWKLTRPGFWVEFKAGDPVCFFFPIRRGDISGVSPVYAPLSDEDLAQFRAWSASRNAFHEEMRRSPPVAPADKWQKLYYQGKDMRGTTCPSHVSKLRLPEFKR